MVLKDALKALPVDLSVALRWLAQKFPTLPQEVLARIPTAASYDASKVAWNRRQRRTWLRSKALALHLFSGPQKKFWEIPRQNAHCVCVDIQENLLDDQTYAFLQSLALTGRLSAVFGGVHVEPFIVKVSAARIPKAFTGQDCIYPVGVGLLDAQRKGTHPYRWDLNVSHGVAVLDCRGRGHRA